MSSVNTNEAQKPFCIKAPQMWNQLPVDLRTIGSFSCFKMVLKQYLMMTRSCHNCFNWCYSCVILVYCVCVYVFAYHRSCLKMGFQPHLHTQLTNQWCHGCIFLNLICLYQMGLPYVLAIHFMPTCLYHTDNPSEIDFSFTFKSLGPTEPICVLKYKLQLLFCHRRTKRPTFF